MTGLSLRVLVMFVVPGLVFANLSSTRVNIENGGYTGVVVAIHPDVREDPQLIESIKKSWTEASQYMYIATGNRAYFRNITILVPRSWTENSYASATGSENFDQADAIIAPPNPSFGNTPYTIQHDGCGKPGVRIHFTPEYLLNETHVENFGPRGRVVVHEWAHYRWGVFDETSDENPFYWDPKYGPDRGPVATTCPRDVPGKILNLESNYLQCDLSDLDNGTNSYRDSCVFFPLEARSANINTSIMALHYLDEVLTFCSDDVDDSNRHNIYALNEQNRLCSMRSVWSVIKETPDYRNWTLGIPTSMTVQDTESHFEVVRLQPLRYVLVLDDSGSMANECGDGDATRTECLGTAASKFITEYAPNGSYVGLVKFGSPSAPDTNIIADLTWLDSSAHREQLAAKLELNASSGSTCIGCGIQKGIEALTQAGDEAAGGHLIVITDGDENSCPCVAEVTEEVFAERVTVSTIFISNENNEDLKNLASWSGGNTYFAESQEDLLTIFSSISTLDSTEDLSFQIHSESFKVSKDKFESSVFIDATVGSKTVFSFIWGKGNSPPNIVIHSPAGCSYSNKMNDVSYCNGGSASHTISEQFRTITFHIPGLAEVGEWRYLVEKSNDGVDEMTSSVSSAPANADVEPIMIESGMSQTDIGEGEPAIVYAKVTQGYNPILGASVVATVSRGVNSIINIQLYDNGAGSDIRRDDGIYSRYFTEFSGPGRYSVEINVKTGDDAAGESKIRLAGSKANYIPGYVDASGVVNVNANGAVSNEIGSTSDGIQSQELGNFTRIASAGSFDYIGTVNVNSGTAYADIFPPGRIIDLWLRQRNLSDYTDGVVLQFTAPGDDYDRGQANEYIIRYTFDDPTSLINDFDGSKRVSESDVLSGNMNDPSLAGATETFIVKTCELPVDRNGNVVNNSRLAFAVKAIDSNMNFGDSSNVAVINFFISPLTLPPDSEVTTELPVTSASTTMATDPTKTTPKIVTCPECMDCDRKIVLFTGLSSLLGIIAAIFLTSTIILGIWLRKSNKQLAKKERSNLKGIENTEMAESGWHGNKRWFPVVKQPPPSINGNIYDHRRAHNMDF